MGYETKIELIGVRVKSDCADLVAQAIRGEVAGTEVFRYMLRCLNLLPDGRLEWADYPIGKWREDEAFVGWLADCCAGGVVSLRSQEGDGAAWAYEFDGAGGVAACTPQRAAAMKGQATRRAQRAATKGRGGSTDSRSSREDSARPMSPPPGPG